LEAFDEVPDLPGLEEINMQQTAIANIAEIGKLAKYKNLKRLSVAETPLAEE